MLRGVEMEVLRHLIRRTGVIVGQQVASIACRRLTRIALISIGFYGLCLVVTLWATEQRATEQRATEQRATEQRATEQRATEQIATEPWDGKPFSGKPEEILQTLKDRPRPEDSNVEILLEESIIHVDEQNRVEETTHRIYRCLTRDSIRSWGNSEVAWSPWCGERPTVRARVISPDGKVHWLDPKNVAEVPVNQDSATVLSSRKRLRAPLPAVDVGSVVEEVTQTRQFQPFFAQGEVRRWYFASFETLQASRLVLDVPKDSSLRFEVRGMELKPQDEIVGKRRRVTFDRRPCEKIRSVESHMPKDIARQPYVVYSFGKSWQAVASDYAKVVSPKVDVDAVRELAQKTVTSDMSRRQAANALLAEVHRLVRYTGLAFGQSAIVPYSPTETLKRRYGDCKDQATLLVSMLRAVGYDAHLALVRNGVGEEIRPGLPGLVFNHAIVYMPGDDSIWIDPTARYLPAGILPQNVQNRWALVADPSTTELIRTTRLKPEDNWQQEIYEYHLSPWERGKVVETFRAMGDRSIDSRRFHHEDGMKEVRKAWQEYGDETYPLQKITSIRNAHVDNSTKPIEIVVEMEVDNIGAIDIAAALVSVQPTELFDELPAELSSVDSPRNGTDAEDKPYERQHPMELLAPYRHEAIYRIVPPPGYEPRRLPRGKKRKFGSVLFQQDFMRRADGAIELSYKLDTGVGRLTPEDVAAMREFILGSDSIDGIPEWFAVIGFDHLPTQKIAAGKIREGVTLFQSLIEKHPQHPELRGQFAETLLELGFGTAAREQALRLAKERPDSSWVQQTLGNALLHDQWGHYLSSGMDYEGALSAYDKAIKLKPDALMARFQYAIILEHDSQGLRYGPDSRLDDAIRRYIKLRKEVDSYRLLNFNLAYALLHAERYDELHKVCQQLPADDERNKLLLTSIAITQGEDAALAQVRRLESDPVKRVQLLLRTGDQLNWSREYQLSEQVLMRAAQGQVNEARIRNLAKAIGARVRLDQHPLPDDDPRGVVRELYEEAYLGGVDAERLKHLFSKDANLSEIEVTLGVLRERISKTLKRQRELKRTPQWSGDTAGDLQYVLDDSGDKELCTIQELNITWYVTLEDGRYRVLATDQQHTNFGHFAIDALDAGDTEKAKRWLNLATTDRQEKTEWFKPFSGAPFQRLLHGTKTSDKESLRLAAAALAVGGSRFTAAEKLLLEARKQHQGSWQEVQIDRALASGYFARQKWAEAAAVAARVLEKYPDAQELIHCRTRSLQALGQTTAELETVRQMLETSKAKGLDRELLIQRAGHLGDFATCLKHFKQLVEDDKASALAYNELAWNQIFAGGANEEALKNALQCNQLSAFRVPTYLHTLATVYAELGQTSQARAYLMKSIDADGGTPAAHHWYTMGRIAQNEGLSGVAVSCFRQMPRPSRYNANDCFVLGEKYLKQLAP